MTFSEVSLLKILMNAYTKVSPQMNLNVQKLSQCIKNDKKDKINYRPGSILSNISKQFERSMHQQINILYHFYQSFNAVSDKDSMHNSAF